MASETIQSIVAEWRDCIESADPSVWNDERIAGLVKNTKAQQLAYLDRVEAAWKREKAEAESDALAVGGIVEAARTTEKSSAVGNAAAMREALENLVYNIELRASVFDIFSIVDRKAWMDAKAALSAPARNCDCYKDADSAYIAFCGYDFAAKDISDSAFIDWLFAPAAERKGEGA